MTRQARNVGILFADIAGSMRLYETFGNRGALAAIEMCLGVISNVVSQSRGFVVKTIGDEIMACLPDPVETWAAALHAQQKVDGLPALPSRQGPIKLSLRVGFDFGQAIENNGDFFGSTVNMAARMVQLAKREQIITTSDGQGLLPKGHRFLTRELDWVAVKGKPDGVQVVEVLWKENTGERSTIIGPPPVPGPQEATNELRLRLGLREWRFDSRVSRVSIGREQTNDVVVSGTSASRNHATIERRRDRWVLVDHSSNGTFVAPAAAGEEIHLRHEELILGREGAIGFGHSVELSPADCLSFVVNRPPA